MYKLLVTGSSGYIGSNFMKIYGNNYHFKPFSLQHEKLSAIDFKNLDVILHCAALVHQKRDFSYEKYHDINTKYPLELAKKAKALGLRQFIFISTIAVYGEEKQAVREDTPCEPITSYAKSKREAEKQLLALEDENFKVSIIRPPMVYGHGAPGNIASLIKLVSLVPILPLGKINNKRSFVYIGNLCYYIDAIIEQRKSGIFLVADDAPVSTTGLIELIAKNLNKKVYLIRVPFFESLLKLVKPSFHKRLYGSLEIDNQHTKERLFGEVKTSLPYSVEKGIELMIKGEKE